MHEAGLHSPYTVLPEFHPVYFLDLYQRHQVTQPTLDQLGLPLLACALTPYIGADEILQIGEQFGDFREEVASRPGLLGGQAQVHPG